MSRIQRLQPLILNVAKGFVLTFEDSFNSLLPNNPQNGMKNDPSNPPKPTCSLQQYPVNPPPPNQKKKPPLRKISYNLKLTP